MSSFDKTFLGAAIVLFIALAIIGIFGNIASNRAYDKAVGSYRTIADEGGGSGGGGYIPLSLADYPEPFLLDGYPNNIAFVVGDDAPSLDLLTITDIASKLATELAPGEGLPQVLLASELPNPEDFNIITVGDPCTNSLVAHEFGMPYPTCGEDMGLVQGEGVIEFRDNGDNYMLIVSGYDPIDRRRVGRVFYNYEIFYLHGASGTVTGMDIKIGLW